MASGNFIVESDQLLAKLLLNFQALQRKIGTIGGLMIAAQISYCNLGERTFFGLNNAINFLYIAEILATIHTPS